jgi:hypothetical protein
VARSNAARAAPARADGDPRENCLLGGSDHSSNALPSPLHCTGLGEIECELLLCELATLNEHLHRRLFDLGVSGPAVAGPDMFAALHFDAVIFLPDARFEFARHRNGFGARPAVVIPARDECGDLADLVALDLETGECGTWRGRAAMLGAENVFAPRIGEPLTCHATPLEWLQAGRRGVFVIDPSRAASLLHAGGGPLEVRSVDAGLALRAALTIEAPPILVNQDRAA